MSFFSGVYGSSIGFTNAIGTSAKQFVGLNGVFIGVGEVLGGVAFGLLGTKLTARYGRDPVVIVGGVLHLASYFLIYLNLPNAAPFGNTDAVSYIQPPSAVAAMACSFLLGLGDACFNTQCYSMLGGVFKNEPAEAFSIFKFTQVRYSFFPGSRLETPTANGKCHRFPIFRNPSTMLLFRLFYSSFELH